MKPLSPAEAADLARVVSHPAFADISRCAYGWICGFRGSTLPILRRTLRAAIRAAVRWMEEQGNG